ncbi:MAG: redoxin domain-containing protein [Thermomicrobiales bacterium]
MLLFRLILAGVFLVSGIAKLLDLAGSQSAMRSFGVPEPATKYAGIALPIVEIFVAVLLLPVASARWGALLGLGLLLAFIGGISNSLAKGQKFDCHCFGQLSPSEIGPKTLIRNAALAVLALFIVIPGFTMGNVGASIGDAFGSLSGFDWVVTIVGIAMIAALGTMAWLLVHLLGQNGRLLVRLDRIESALEDADIEIDYDDEDDEDDEDEEDEDEEGLPFGAPAPAFTLSGLYGETLTLDSFRAQEKPVLLVFSDPTCGPCNGLMPDVGKWQHELADKLTTVVVTRGSVEDNRAKKKAHNLTNVVMQAENEIADAYMTYGTPTAVLVSADGKIASGAAGGGPDIRKLVKNILENKVPVPAPRAPRPAPAPTAPQPVRGVASIGKDAPVVELNNLDNEPVKLTDFAGHPTAVLFWNPGCGFCQRMVDDLKAWEGDKPEGAPNLLVVSTGEVDANKATGLASPVVLDSGFTVGRAFGASGTPSAVLVSADGKIASGLAVGSPSVIALLRNEAPHLLDAAAVEPEPEAPPAPRGIGIGGTAPEFTLKDLEDDEVTLDDVADLPAVLVFWNPGCGFCKRLEPELKAWEEETEDDDDVPDLVFITTGSIADNEAHGFESPMLIDPNFSIGSMFGASGTPSAILIDEDGKVASTVKVGGPEVMALLRSS